MTKIIKTGVVTPSSSISATRCEELSECLLESKVLCRGVTWQFFDLGEKRKNHQANKQTYKPLEIDFGFIYFAEA